MNVLNLSQNFFYTFNILYNMFFLFFFLLAFYVNLLENSDLLS